MRFPSKINAFEFIRKAGVEIGTILDVGAKVTGGELLGAFPDKRHLLFEPVSEAHPKMASTYKGTRHEIFGLALSDVDGTADLLIERIGSSEITHASLAPKEPGREYRRVSTARLDTFLAQRKDPAPYLLKIDVDGHDLAILNGAYRALDKTAILILEVQTTNFIERAKAAEDNGFQLIDIVDLAYYNGLFHQADLVFIRAELRERYPLLHRLDNATLDWKLWEEHSEPRGGKART